MAIYTQIGIPFTIKDWRNLFKKDYWFLWQRPSDRFAIILKRLTLWNVLKWYFFQVCIYLVTAILYPILRLAYLYWNDIEEGQQTRVISERILMQTKRPEIKFFRLGK